MSACPRCGDPEDEPVCSTCGYVVLSLHPAGPAGGAPVERARFDAPRPGISASERDSAQPSAWPAVTPERVEELTTLLADKYLWDLYASEDAMTPEDRTRPVARAVLTSLVAGNGGAAK